MILHIVRHGEKEKGEFYNAGLERQDNPLSEKGLIQAELLADSLPRSIERVYASCQKRTAQTASPFARKQGLSITEDPRINEIHLGILSRMSDSEAARSYPDFWKEFTERTGDFRYPEGESGAEVSLRIASLIQDIYSPEQEVLIASHDGWIRIFLCIMLDLPFHYRFRFKIANCGLTSVRLDSPDMSGQILALNDHLWLGQLASFDA